MTSAFPNLQELNRLEAALPCSLFGTSHRSKAIWHVFYSDRSRPFPRLLTVESGLLAPPLVATGFSDVNGLH